MSPSSSRWSNQSGFRREMFVSPIPVHGRRQALSQRHLRGITKLGELADIRAAPLGAAGGRRAGDKLDLTPGMGGDALRHIRDGNLFGGANVINPKMLALSAHHHHAAHQIIDVTEAAGLPSIALDFEWHLAALVLRGGAFEA